LSRHFPGRTASPRTVKLTILPGKGYVVGSHLHAKITIVKDSSSGSQ
jgi:hypothetical protein